jgi:hypothetical protein
MNRWVNSGEFIDPLYIRPMSDTAKNPNLGGVEVAEPEQEAREATAVYARCFLERAVYTRFIPDEKKRRGRCARSTGPARGLRARRAA